METTTRPDAIYTNGRAYAALVGEAVILPNGRQVTEDTAEEMGFETEVDIHPARLAPACLEALEAHTELLDNADAKRKEYDALLVRQEEMRQARIAARKAERAAYLASPEGRAETARIDAEWKAIARAIRRLNGVFA